MSFAKATQLRAFLENEKLLLDQEIKQLHYNRMLRDKQFRQLYEVCPELTDSLSRINYLPGVLFHIKYFDELIQWHNNFIWRPADPCFSQYGQVG